MIKYFNYFLVLLIGSIICTSCGKFESGEFTSAEIVISDSDEHSIRYQANEQELKFIVEDLNNISMNFDTTGPNRDFIILYVDVNNNNVGDANIDKLYSTRADSDVACVALYITPTSISPCTEELGYSIEQSFISTLNNTTDHVVYELIMRKEFFPTTNEIGLKFRMGGLDSTGYVPSLTSKLFANTVVISWD